ncbi:hypothetical protein A9Q99_23690 [Gammaproteobacteria bacterium 45_16_T64]|nr:hypothetical protein A9Q99_23690 [Gammaproteobacteria bacterium 45_16_T64]
MKLFIRQSFTQADRFQSKMIQQVINVLEKECPSANFLTGRRAMDRDNFAAEFERITGIQFSPAKFREYRLNLIDESDALVFIRTSMSESSAFELSYNLHSTHPKPVFYAHWHQAIIETTLLRELEEDYPVMYTQFRSVTDIRTPFRTFLNAYGLSLDVMESTQGDVCMSRSERGPKQSPL